jgi:hypothetical protein
MTRFPSMKNTVVSQFDTREDLLWAIVASMCLPLCFIRDFPVQIKGEGGCIDGKQLLYFKDCQDAERTR